MPIRLRHLSLLLSLSGAAVAAPAGGAPSYDIDQTRYFSSPSDEEGELRRCVLELEALAKGRAGAVAAPATLLAHLRSAEALLGRLRRHTAYLHLRSARDIDDAATAKLRQQAGRLQSALVDGAYATLRQFGRARFTLALVDEPGLQSYAYLLAGAERMHEHDLPPAEQAILDGIGDPAAAALWKVYQQTLRTTVFGKVRAADGEFDVDKDAAALALHPNRAVRKSAWQQRWEGYAARKPLYAATLLGVVELGERSARLSHFDDAPSAAYFGRGLNRADVVQALAQVAEHAALSRRYQRLRAEQVARSYGLEEVHAWDMALSPPGFVASSLTLDQTRAVSLKALAPLGADYVEHFRALLDPANGRMDIGSAQGKRVSDGFSISAPGVPSGLFVDKYDDGHLPSSRVVIHEGGHAVHGQLMNEGGVSPFYVRGPNWMFEAIATLNEFLLYDYLCQTSAEPAAKAFYLNALINDMSFQVFGSAQEAMLEQGIYDGARAGSINKADDLDALTLKIWSQFDELATRDPERRYSWMSKRLMYQDPLYLVNYLYSGVLAAKMFEMVKADPADFQLRYQRLLRGGFTAEPKTVLAQFFGAEVSQQALVDGGLGVLEKKVDELEALYRQMNSSKPAPAR